MYALLTVTDRATVLSFTMSKANDLLSIAFDGDDGTNLDVPVTLRDIKCLLDNQTKSIEEKLATQLTRYVQRF